MTQPASLTLARPTEQPLPDGVKPCPFCGLPPVLEHEPDLPHEDSPESWWLSCRNAVCPVELWTTAGTRREVLSQWNGRKP
jgi:hypothetical protein